VVVEAGLAANRGDREAVAIREARVRPKVCHLEGTNGFSSFTHP
jgi:hypothetical protein